MPAIHLTDGVIETLRPGVHADDHLPGFCRRRRSGFKSRNKSDGRRLSQHVMQAPSGACAHSPGRLVGSPCLAKPTLHHPAPHPGPEGFSGRSEEHTSELQSLMRISYAGFCLKKKKKTT